MKVLHVAAGNAYGGIERMLVTLAATPHARLTQEFAVAFGGRLEKELCAAGAVVHRLPSPRASRPLLIWRARGAFSSVLEATQPDAAIFHGAWPHAMFAATSRAAGARIGFWQHEPIERPAWPDRWARRVRPDFVVFNSRFTGARPAFPDLPGEVIHCPVPASPRLDPAERRRLRAALGAGEEDVVVLMAARFERWKGHGVLLRGAELTSGRIRVWLAGRVPRRGEARPGRTLAARAALPPLDRIASLPGDREDLPALMQLADLYCQPNPRGEPFGIAIAEAMRAGLPCVVSAAGAAAELVDDSCAVVAPPGDAAAVADALRELAGDPARRSRMGHAARRRSAGLADPASRLDDLEAAVAGRPAR